MNIDARDWVCKIFHGYNLLIYQIERHNPPGIMDYHSTKVYCLRCEPYGRKK